MTPKFNPGMPKGSKTSPVIRQSEFPNGRYHLIQYIMRLTVIKELASNFWLVKVTEKKAIVGLGTVDSEIAFGSMHIEANKSVKKGHTVDLPEGITVSTTETLKDGNIYTNVILG